MMWIWSLSSSKLKELKQINEADWFDYVSNVFKCFSNVTIFERKCCTTVWQFDILIETCGSTCPSSLSNLRCMVKRIQRSGLFLGVLRNLPMVTCLKKGPPSNMLSCQLMESHLNGCSLSWIRLKQKNASNLTCKFIEEPIGCKHVVQHCAFEFSDSIALQLHLLTTCGPAWLFLSYFALPFHTWCWDESGYETAQRCKICYTG